MKKVDTVWAFIYFGLYIIREFFGCKSKEEPLLRAVIKTKIIL